ncbi:outer membrane beta-barrel protein [Labilibaculum sp. A4]|uniref:outer membrane beta-barrel protein n=1 Tax=Labilibaculum euxinus TaxID=2686357 RepID=UPI000F61680E|nr:outer membrane beta-barrel protein [Labilibaculum euxinus]MDQ1769535.1 TonB-dependent receptor [Labilibaculum euxinus]MWN75060.1 outer membrane beta-barrel protein [Labilibaculum euxinus]
MKSNFISKMVFSCFGKKTIYTNNLIKYCVSIYIVFSVSFFSSAQKITITGNLNDQTHNPIEYFHAMLLSSNDSILIVGGAFLDGNFELIAPNKGDYILSFSCLGYQSRHENMSITQNTDLGEIRLKQTNLNLKEVNIAARRPSFKEKRGKIIMNVVNTSISDLGSTIDVLERAPGVIIDNQNNISVFGKGSPLIFIDDKEVVVNNELESIQSDDIASIEIDRNPSAVYSSNARSVIRIKTKKAKRDQLNVQAYNYATFARKFQNFTGVKVNNTKGKLSNFFQFAYENTKLKTPTENFQYNYQQNYTIQNNSNTTENLKRNRYILFLGSKYSINTKNEINFQYSYNGLYDENNTLSVQKINKTNELEDIRRITNHTNEDREQHNSNINYKLEIDSISYYSLSMDFARISAPSKSNIQELNPTQNSELQSKILNSNTYHVYTLNSRYQYSLLSQFKSAVGIKLAQIENSGNTESTYLPNNDIFYQGRNVIKDKVLAGYFTVNKQLRNVNFDVGIRLEHSITKIKSNRETVVDCNSTDVFPSLLINYQIDKNKHITFSYAKKNSRPSFSELNPSLDYIDSLSYEQGNPLLKPTIYHSFALDYCPLKKLSFSAEYTNLKNTILFTGINDPVNPDIIKHTAINIDRSEKINFMSNYSYSVNNYSFFISNGVEFPIINAPYLNSEIKIRRASWYSQIKNDIYLNKNILLYCKFKYQSKTNYDLTIMRNRYNLSCGIQTKILQKKLLISLSANDILNNYNADWYNKYQNIKSGQLRDHDTSYLRLYIRYNFNNFKNVFNKKNMNSEELNRL